MKKNMLDELSLDTLEEVKIFKTGLGNMAYIPPENFMLREVIETLEESLKISTPQRVIEALNNLR